MPLSASRKVGLTIALAMLLFVWWYVEAEDFGDEKVAGRYVFQHDGITQRLTLDSDHTFRQEDDSSGTKRYANGTWRVFSSTGHMAFSSSFIDAPDAWRGRDEHEVYCIVKNYLGWVSITFDDSTPPVKAYKKIFS